MRKLLLFLLPLLLVCFVGLYSQDLYYGYNNVGSNYSRMFQYPLYEDAIVESLSQTLPENKVLRFPDGQESINNRVKFNDDFTNEFIDFCVDAGVNKVVLRADFNDVPGSVRTYKLLENHPQIDVLYVEASNEPYEGANIRPLNWREWLDSIFNKNRYHNTKANQYVNKTQNLYNAFTNQGIDISSKFAFACPVPDLGKYKVWYNVLDRRLGYLDHIVIHLYGNPPPSNPSVQDLDTWLDQKLQALELIDDKYNKISTEFSSLRFGRDGKERFVAIAHTDIHREMHQMFVQRLYDADFTLLMYHKHMGEDESRKYGKIIVNAITGATKRYTEWL